MSRIGDAEPAGPLQQKLRRLEEQVRAHGSVYSRAAAAETAGLSPKTVGEWFSKSRVPRNFETLWDLLQILLEHVSGRGRDTQDDRAWWAAQRAHWHYLWEGAREAQDALPPRPSAVESTSLATSGTPVIERTSADSGEDSRRPVPGLFLSDLLDPMALEVHPTIRTTSTATDLPLLTPYIERKHDRLLRQRVREAADGHSSIVVLVGDSSTGKTRACWEAVQELPAEWRLWHPIAPGRPEALANALDSGAIAPRSVLWLNDAHHYLRTNGPLGERISSELRELLRTTARGPILVLATLWPDDWNLLTQGGISPGDDPHAHARALLVGRSIPVPHVFTSTELRALRLGTPEDPRLAEAAARAEDGQVAQYLAGSHALVERYESAPAPARAIIDAAIDACRLGHSLFLQGPLLRDAAPGYLTDQQQDELPDNWYDEALSYVTDPRPCRGARAPLSRSKSAQGETDSEQPLYRLADYLEQHGGLRRAAMCPPSSFWLAAAGHVTDADDRFALGAAAEARGQDGHALALYRHAADVGHAESLWKLAAQRERLGDGAGAEEFAFKSVRAGNSFAIRRLVRMRDWDAGEQLAITAAMAGHTHAFSRLVWELEMADAWDDVRKLWERAAEAGHSPALIRVADDRERMGDVRGAEACYRRAIESGDIDALGCLARLKEDAEDLKSAETLYRQAIDGGSDRYLVDLSEMLDRAGERVAAEEAMSTAVESGLIWACTRLARAREVGGDLASAEVLYRKAAEAGDPQAMLWMMLSREHESDHAGADKWAARAVRAGRVEAYRELADARERRGDLVGADNLYQEAVRAGDMNALPELVIRREHAGQDETADDLAVSGLAANDARPVRALLQLRRQAGNRRRAARLALRSLSAGYSSPLHDMARELRQAGQEAEALTLYRQAIDAGATEVLLDLARMCSAAGDTDGAQDYYSRAIDAGHTTALLDLAEMCSAAGDTDGAQDYYSRAIDAGHTTALLDLAEMCSAAGDTDGAQHYYSQAIDAGHAHHVRRQHGKP
jgi:tetratricopeptide (TPR) repeat protein